MQVLIKANLLNKPVTQMGNKEVRILSNQLPDKSQGESIFYVAPDQIIPAQDFQDLLDYLREERDLYPGLFDEVNITTTTPEKRKHYRKGAYLLNKHEPKWTPKINELCFCYGQPVIVESISKNGSYFMRGGAGPYDLSGLDPYALPAVDTIVEIRLHPDQKWRKAIVSEHSQWNGFSRPDQPCIDVLGYQVTEFAGEDLDWQFRRIYD